jgi:hypothetical protein
MHKRQRLFYLVLAFVLLGLIGWIRFNSSFELFADQPILLKSIPTTSKSSQINLYHIPSNATSQDYIQARKVSENGKEQVIANFERYTTLHDYRVWGDSTLQLILTETSAYLSRRVPLN